MARKTNLTDQEVAELLMTSPVTVCEWVQRGQLHARIDIAGHRLFGLEDVHNYAREYSIGLSRPDRERLRILVIDADPKVSRLLRGLFGGASDTLEVQVVRDVFDAGRRMHTFRPDVVLLDFTLPHHDGYEICRRIKADPASRDVRVIAMIRGDDAALRQRVLMAGAEACVAKPLRSREVFDAIGVDFEPRAHGDALR